MLKFIYQAIKVVVVAGVLAAGLWFVHSKILGHNRIACVQAQLPEGRVCPETVFGVWKGKDVLWIDARPMDAFERGTVKNARVKALRMDENYNQLLTDAMSEMVNADVIVVFCDKSCTASTDVAHRLKDPNLGIDAEIYVLEGGWEGIDRFQQKRE